MIAHKLFDFVIDRDMLTEWKSDRLPTMCVLYTLDQDGTIEIKAYDAGTEVHKLVKDWDNMKEEIMKAARNNSESHRWPAEKRKGRMRPVGLDSYQDIHDQWKSEVQEKERQGW